MECYHFVKNTFILCHRSYGRRQFSNYIFVGQVRQLFYVWYKELVNFLFIELKNENTIVFALYAILLESFVFFANRSYFVCLQNKNNNRNNSNSVLSTWIKCITYPSLIRRTKCLLINKSRFFGAWIFLSVKGHIKCMRSR